ncbi:MAG: DUF1576 domain-containing protein [Defluviitaleaceae bacterium]|nr:DUF1576 domain-containing protein [Defluviitaleaceae bacterium]
MVAQNTNIKLFTAYKVWGALLVITIAYGFIVAFLQHGSDGLMHILDGLWVILTSPALLATDYVALAGVGPAFVNAGLTAFLSLGALKFARLEGSGPQMAALALALGFGLMGKNPLNTFPILFGAYLYSLFVKQPYKNNVTMAIYSLCLAPVVSQPAFIPEITAIIGVNGGIILGALMGLFFGFIINAMSVFTRKSHEGLNLYNVGWGAGLIAIALALLYSTMGVEQFGPVSNTMWNIGPGSGYYNRELYIYIIMLTVFFLVVGFASGGSLRNIKQILYLKASETTYLNNFYAKYDRGVVYLAKGFLGILALLVTLGLGGIHLNGLIVGAIISMVGWGGFGKTVANAAVIIGGVFLGGIVRYFINPYFFAADIDFLVYITSGATAHAIWTAAFWGTCLSPAVRFFGWRWGLLIGMVHFGFVTSIAYFHWGQNLYNNGLAAGFVCMIMIPIIRAIDKRNKYGMEKVYPDPDRKLP